jgi:DNA-binding helix-hairpin-helix protein with protein kinase domain
MPLYSDQGQTIQLGNLLGKGGEGAVYEIAGDPQRVGKLYHRPEHANLEKLAAMVRLSNAVLAKVSAWPERTLHVERGGRVVGFVMPRVRGTSLSELLGPGSRKIIFPSATYPFVVRAAVNLARAFATAHTSGAVIGDVKEVNQLVSGEAIVTLVDTDGFQIRDPQSGKLFPTTAVTPTHQPPELQGLEFSHLVRTPDQDAFGLAVLIFQLLFMGRHPFAGVPVARRDLEIPDAIKLFQFSWAPTLQPRLYQQPPATLSLTSVSPLDSLFLRAFLATQAGTRPSSAEWSSALETYEKQLRKCPTNPTHAFIGVGPCPLCSIETQTNTLFFLGQEPAAIQSVFDTAAIWSQIEAVPSPGKPPALPPLPVRVPLPHAVAVGRLRRRQRWAALAVLFVGSLGTYTAVALIGPPGLWPALATLAAAWIVWAQGTQDSARYAKARQEAQAQLNVLQKEWETSTGDAAFRQKKDALAATRDLLRKLDDERRQRFIQLQQTTRQRQLDRYLQTHRINQGRIPKIGQGRITTLRSFNIETAYDITPSKLAHVPGFGAALTGALFSWRRQIEAGFRFDAARGVDPSDVAALDREISAKRAQPQQMLRIGAVALRQISEQSLRRRKELGSRVDTTLAAVAQAEADAKAAA